MVSRRFFLLLASIFSIALGNSSGPQLKVVPYPAEVTLGEGFASVDPKLFDMRIVECNADCDLIDRAISRYMKIIFQPPHSTGTVFRLSIFEDRINATVPTAPTGDLTQLKITIRAKVPLIFFYFLIPFNFQFSDDLNSMCRPPWTSNWGWTSPTPWTSLLPAQTAQPSPPR
jgi:hypothetical protein